MNPNEVEVRTSSSVKVWRTATAPPSGKHWYTVTCTPHSEIIRKNSNLILTCSDSILHSIQTTGSTIKHHRLWKWCKHLPKLKPLMAWQAFHSLPCFLTELPLNPRCPKCPKLNLNFKWSNSNKYLSAICFLKHCYWNCI